MSDHANAIETHAVAVRCDRHIPHMRGCAWIDNQPCACRIAVDETKSVGWGNFPPKSPDEVNHLNLKAAAERLTATRPK